ncbi:hypothetical protein PMAYCL1PPCAC_21375 [Pristionchus mayeri]|uniref:Uncharacterized protein n=1 Tax=Pristionchus mayeri TaxID=1317129 RepID=A0AAN5I4K6_9BILA|nr:hypothetical protein PMAYCL1PPCAC_21375 [Pristionchus mayeri]
MFARACLLLFVISIVATAAAVANREKRDVGDSFTNPLSVILNPLKVVWATVDDFLLKPIRVGLGMETNAQPTKEEAQVLKSV